MSRIDAPTHHTPSSASHRSPAATRTQSPGWRDPRLWAGVAIVALSVVAGARLVGAADQTVSVWAAADGLGPGHELAADDLVPSRVHFDDPADLARYLPTDAELPPGPVLVHAVGNGELVPRSALGAAGESGTVTVSVVVPGEVVPTGVGPGSLVDVYVVGETARARPEGSPVLEDVVVVDAPAPAQQLGAVGSGRQIVLSVPVEQEGTVGQVLSANRDDRVRVVLAG